MMPLPPSNNVSSIPPLIQTGPFTQDSMTLRDIVASYNRKTSCKPDGTLAYLWSGGDGAMHQRCPRPFSSYRYKNHHTLQTFCMLGTDKCSQLAPTHCLQEWMGSACKGNGGQGDFPHTKLPAASKVKLSSTKIQSTTDWLALTQLHTFELGWLLATQIAAPPPPPPPPPPTCTEYFLN